MPRATPPQTPQFAARRCDRTAGPITRLWGSLWAHLSLREGGENRTRTPSSTTRRLVAASVSPNTRESYTRALRQFDTWRGRRPLDDATLAAYLADLYDSGRSPSVAAPWPSPPAAFAPAFLTTRTRAAKGPAASSQASAAPPTTYPPSLPRATVPENPGAVSRLRPPPPGAADWTP